MKQTPEELLARAYALSDETETKALYRDWAQSYDATMLDGLGYLTPARTVDLLATDLTNLEARILDVGCGTGLAGAELAGRGFSNIDALDFSAEMLKVASHRQAKGHDVYCHLIEADLNQRLGLETAAYDALVSTGTFTHAHVGASCLDELFRVLKPGGLFACTVHKDIWQPAGFAEKTETFTKAGTLETLVREPGPYFTTSKEPDGFYILWRRVA